MKRTILTLTILLATAFSAFAQIENEIMQSKMEKISKGRAYLLEKFLDRDYDKVKEIKDYLLGLEDDNYVALRHKELWLIFQWTKEYDELISLLRRSDSAYLNDNVEYGYFDVRTNKKVFPNIDVFMSQLYSRSAEDKHLLQFGLQEADLIPEDKAFLTMFLDWLFVKNNNFIKDENQMRLNEMATQFLSDYPNSDYEWFVRHVIRVKMEMKDWVWGLYLGFGSGVFTQDLKEWMKGSIAGCMGFEASYKRVRFATYFDGVDIKLRENPSEKGDGSLIAFNVSVGYDVVGTRRISLTPFAAVGIGKVSSNELGSIPELAPLTAWRMNYEVGTDFDFRYSEFRTRGPLPLYIRLRYWYDMPSMGRIGPELSGGCHCFMVGFGVSIAEQKRVY